MIVMHASSLKPLVPSFTLGDHNNHSYTNLLSQLKCKSVTMQTQNWISFSMYQEKWHCWLYWLHCFRWLCYWSPWQSIFTNCSENNTYSCPNCVASTHSHFMPIEIEQTSEEVKGLWNSHTVLLVHLEWGGTHVSINFPYPFLCLLLNPFKTYLIAILSLYAG